ncbi:unnamed protein product, partial [marine sediment metagenome]
GQVAAYGFAQLEDVYSTVVLLGPTHQAYFQGAVIDESDFWQTPLGRVSLDKNLARRIVESDPQISFSSQPHQREHCLEVEVPFLQRTLSKFSLIPILLGQVEKGFLEKLADVLAGNITSDTLVIVSTDLSHYPQDEIANKVDKVTIESILSGDVENFKATISAQLREGYPNLDTCACGQSAVEVGMRLAKKLGIEDARLLKYANSGDVTGDKSRVVGYAAIGYFEKSKVKSQKKLLEIARRTLESYLKDGKVPDFEVVEPKLLEPHGAFVTLRKNGQLRGCIGEFEAKEPLWKVVRRMSTEAATRDPRFSPVRLIELSEIKIEISVLSPLKKIDDPDKIKLGVHGVMIKKGLRKGVFLSQVADETGWDKETFMGQLCTQKAGLSWDCWKKGDVDIFVFTVQVFEEESE